MARRGICYLSVFAFLLLLLCFFAQPARAAGQPLPEFTIYGGFSQPITLDDVYFDPDRDFNGATTTYNPHLARFALLMTMAGCYEGRYQNAAAQFGFTDCVIRDDDMAEGDPISQTGYTLSTRQITRNGEPCTLMVVMVNYASGGSGWVSNFDFLNLSDNGSIDYDSPLAAGFTDAAARVLGHHHEQNDSLQDRIDRLAASGQDYLVLVCGQSRGGAVGNYLAKLLVDRYGTRHIMAYLISSPNVDRKAQGPADTSKYNCIFTVRNPDDAVTYVPFGKDYTGWGYDIYGTVLYLKNPSADAELYQTVSSYYRQYAAKTSDSYRWGSVIAIDKNQYYIFEKGGGAELKELIGWLYAALPTPKSYYEGSVGVMHLNRFNLYNAGGSLSLLEAVNPNKKSASAAEINLYQLIMELLDLDTDDTARLDDLIRIGRGSYYNACQMQKPLVYGLKYAAGINDLDDTLAATVADNIVELAFGTAKANVSFTAREGIIPHFPDVYFSWISAAEDGAQVFSTVLPQTAAKSQVQSGGVTACAELAFYSDMTFTAGKTAHGYALSLKRGNAVCEAPTNVVTLRIPSADGALDGKTAYLLNAKGESSPVPLTYHAEGGYYDAPLHSLNGELLLPQPADADYSLLLPEDGKTLVIGSALPLPTNSTVLVAEYDSKGRMIGLTAKKVEGNTVTLNKASQNMEKIYFVNAQNNPLCASVSR